MPCREHLRHYNDCRSCLNRLNLYQDATATLKDGKGSATVLGGGIVGDDASLAMPPESYSLVNKFIVNDTKNGDKTMQKGTKNDDGKPRMDLLSGIWLAGVAKVMGFGAAKYDAHNWRKGIATSRLLGAALRHIFAYLDGEDLDPESGVSHLYHASCCLMFASEMKVTRPDLDDRYKKGKSNDPT